jgi:hypothetical protein
MVMRKTVEISLAFAFYVIISLVAINFRVIKDLYIY